MEKQEIITKLNSLIQLDIDAIHAYEQAMKHINEVDIRDQVAEYRNDHHGHFRELSALVQVLGGSRRSTHPTSRGSSSRGLPPFGA